MENEGVSPDVEAQLDLVAVKDGRDPQLDAAIAAVTEQLKNCNAGGAQDGAAISTPLAK